MIKMDKKSTISFKQFMGIMIIAILIVLIIGILVLDNITNVQKPLTEEEMTTLYNPVNPIILGIIVITIVIALLVWSWIIGYLEVKRKRDFYRPK